VYFGKSAILSKYPKGLARPDGIRVDKSIERFETGRKKVRVNYTKHRIDYEWPIIKPEHWPWFSTLETETEHLARPFWLQWEGQHAEPVFFISEDEALDWEYINGIDRRIDLKAEYL